MKGKVLSLKIILALLIALTAGVCFTFSYITKPIEKKAPVSTAVEIGSNKQEFSALFNNNVIFSVEKVLINASNIEAGTTDSIETEDGYKTFHGIDAVGTNKDYNFKDLPNGEKAKTVVDNGTFVMLNNIYNSNVGDGIYQYEGQGTRQEAIMVSFGAYIYNGEDEDVTIATNDSSAPINPSKTTHSKISYLKVILTKNGQRLEEMDYRNVPYTSPYFDFTYLITQDKENNNEGHYKFDFEYTYDYKTEHTASFEFYLVNKTSYTQTYKDGDVTYNAFPTLGWDEGAQFAKTTKENGYVRYRIGQNGINTTNKIISYPTVTYDYIRYGLSYVHTANGRNTTHTFAVERSTNLGGTTATLVHRTTDITGTTVERKDLEDYNINNSTNLLSIMFTEPGTYNISYKFLYDGYNSSYAPDMNLPTTDITLSIHGLNALYSKYHFESAKMQYFEIANKTNNKVDLLIPNGHPVDADLSKYYDKNLGFVYKLVNSTNREGAILTENSQDALINFNLKSVDTVSTDAHDNDYDCLKNKLADLKDYTKASNFSTIISNIKFAETNQGSLSLKGNDGFIEQTATEDGSFYFFSPIKENILTTTYIDNKGTEDTADDETKTAYPYTNLTSFKAKGYYLVFIKVRESGNLDASGDPITYYQIFAFRYTSNSVDIDLKTEDDSGNYENVLTKGLYTNTTVKATWKTPGIFDRKINAYYYYEINTKYSREEMLNSSVKLDLTYTQNSVQSSAVLGEGQVAAGQFATYLIRIEGEGDAVAHKMFIIDRVDISNVNGYTVEKKANGFYAYAIDSLGYDIQIINSLTDSYATISWDDKASGAETYATYSYTPFVKNDATIEYLNADTISTNYELGTTMQGIDFIKPQSKYSMDDDSVLDLQGIYILHIWDDAGNQCYYAFIIDQTENYINVNNSFVTNTSLVFGDNVNYDAGKYKSFNLNVDADTNQDVKNLIYLANIGELRTFKDNEYYNGSNNINFLQRFFTKTGTNYYFTTKNERINIYNNDNKPIANSNSSLKGTMVYDKDALNGASSLVYKFYIINESNKYSTKKTTDLSNVVIEINKDNSLGQVYYSNSDITAPVESDSVFRLYTGSDNLKTDGSTESGILGARATSAQQVIFSWIMGEDKFEVKEVTYKYYELYPNQFNATEEGGKYYFYNNSQTYDIYKQGDPIDGKSLIESGDRVFFKFNSDTAKEGLYVVSRQYVSSDGLGDDVAIKKYYFIIDRNNIITNTVGGSIAIELMEGESVLGDFNSIYGAEEVVINTSRTEDVDIIDKEYTVYYKTNKVPAQLKVPIGKYFDGVHTSGDYYAGRLNVQVYFNDIYGQFPNIANNPLQKYNNAITKIFDSNAIFKDSNGNDISFNYDVANGFIVIDIYKYLNKLNPYLRDRITESNENGTWLFLSGDYIVRISDNVEEKYKQGNNIVTRNHEVLLGLRINTADDAIDVKNKYPQIDIFNGYKQSDMFEVDAVDNGIYNNEFNFTATVSQEYLEVNIPKYVTNTNKTNEDDYETLKVKAQVDKTYLIVNQYEGENDSTPTYINHPYAPLNGINLTEDNDYIKLNPDGSFNVKLDTKLRDEYGNIIASNFDISLYYTVTIRFRLNNIGGLDNNRYENCYVYYDANNNEYSYFQTTYKIVIDRQAPKENIKYLNDNDLLAKDYASKYGTDEMFENAYHETSTRLHFTKQYAKYYQEEKTNKGNIYVYQINSETPFDKTDVEKVYYKKISSSSLKDLAEYNLTLPFIDTTKYDGSVENVSGLSFVGYSGLFNGKLANNNYYEILEVDKAGNVTQYVIHYNPSDAVINIPVKITPTHTGLEQDYELEFNNEMLNIFKLQKGGASTVENDYFFKIQLEKTNGEIVKTILTDVTTDFVNLSNEIVEMFKDYANYNLKIISKTKQSNIQINLIDRSKSTPLNIEKLIEGNVEDGFVINLNGANEYQNGMLIFAREIIVNDSIETKTYTGSLVGEIVVYSLDGEIVPSSIKCVESTYKITMTDILGNTTSHRFNTNGKHFYDVLGANYQVGSEQIYAYTDLTLEYSKLFTAEYYEFTAGAWKDVVNTPIDKGDYYHINIRTKENAIFEVKIELYEGSALEKTYYITIDNRVNAISLRDYTSGEKQDIAIFNNVEYDDNSVKSNSSSTGILNLHWEKQESEYFNYKYTLYEELKDGTYRKDKNGEIGIDLTQASNYVINTQEDSKGVYKFVISIYGKDGTYLGNRVHAFEVKAIDNNLYYVRNENGEAVLANSSFKVKELYIPEHQNQLMARYVNENINIPLYISNQELDVVLTNKDVEKVCLDLSDNFKFYIITKGEYFNIYLATLYINENDTLLSNLSVNDTSITNSTKITIADNELDKVNINGTVISLDSHFTTNKNLVLVDISHNNKFVKTETFTNAINLYGNGDYTLTFKDLAGNTHKFTNGSTELDVLILKEVPVLLNNQVAIENAFYNEPVKLSVYAHTIFEADSVKIISATRNGNPYSNPKDPYLFEAYGSYEVVVYAEYRKSTTEVVPLTKTVKFEIINTEEALPSINLYELKFHKITKVLNGNNIDVTQNFLTMLNKQKSMTVSYQNIIDNAESLKVTSGKISFTIDYEVNDGLYAKRDLSFKFTLNNEQPKLDCSLKAGETTKKGFHIYYNPAIIHEQIGDSYIYINGKLFASIVGKPENKEESIYISYKQYKDGDFYVKLESSSGRIVDSFKVTIKEPLNAWAIIIIIIAVIVVATIVTVIIVLRRRMRIR